MYIYIYTHTHLQLCESAHHEPAERADAGRVGAEVGAEDDSRERGAPRVAVEVALIPRGGDGAGLPLGHLRGRIPRGAGGYLAIPWGVDSFLNTVGGTCSPAAAMASGCHCGT